MSTTETPSDTLATRVTATEVGRTPGDLIDRSLEGPIAIERRGKVKAVLISASAYDRLAGSADGRVAGKVADIPADLMASAIASIDQALASEDA